MFTFLYVPQLKYSQDIEVKVWLMNSEVSSSRIAGNQALPHQKALPTSLNKVIIIIIEAEAGRALSSSIIKQSKQI